MSGLLGGLGPGEWLVLVGSLSAGVAALLWAISGQLSGTTGLGSSAEIVASDTGQGRVETLRDPELGLVGQPDYILRERTRWWGRPRLVAAEVKPTRTSDELYDADEMQLVVYLLLLRARHGDEAAGYGYVRYADHTFRVELTEARRERCLRIADRVRAARRGVGVDRDHTHGGKCAACSVRSRCDQSLA